MFDSLLQKKDNKLELYLYSKKDGDIFDSDYLYLELVYNGEVKGYIGLKGENKRDIFRFNSVYIDSENRISGKRVDVSNLFIEEISFINKIECSNIIQSPRNINHINKKEHKEKKFKLDNKLINKINKQLRNGYLLKRGNEKATQYNLMRNKNTIIKNFQNTIHWKNEKEIIDYIYNKYPDSKKIKNDRKE